MNSKVLTLLGFAAKAGRISFGMDATVSSIKAKKAELVVVAADVSAKSLKEIKFFADKTPVVVLEIDKEALSHAVGKQCGILSVNDEGFKNSILKLN